MSDFLERLLARSAGEEPAVRPRIDPWDPVEILSPDAAWGEVVDEVPAPPPIRRMARSDVVAGDDPGTTDIIAKARATTIRVSKPAPAQTTDAVESVDRASTATPSSVAPEQVETSAAAVASAPPQGRPTPTVVPTSTTGHDAASVPPKPIIAMQPVRPITPVRTETIQTSQRPRRVARWGGGSVPQLAGGRTAEPVPDVVISIGRIEVRAPATTTSARRAAAPDTSRLDQYFETRTGRSPR